MGLELGQDVLDVRPNPRVNSQVTLRVGIGVPTKHRTDKGQIGPPQPGGGPPNAPVGADTGGLGAPWTWGADGGGLQIQHRDLPPRGPEEHVP
jgi:hypothetical protein